MTRTAVWIIVICLLVLAVWLIPQIALTPAMRLQNRLKTAKEVTIATGNLGIVVDLKGREMRHLLDGVCVYQIQAGGQLDDMSHALMVIYFVVSQPGHHNGVIQAFAHSEEKWYIPASKGFVYLDRRFYRRALELVRTKTREP